MSESGAGPLGEALRLPLRVRGPGGWARRGLRPKRQLELLPAEDGDPATVLAESIEPRRPEAAAAWNKSIKLSIAPDRLWVPISLPGFGLLDSGSASEASAPLLDAAGNVLGTLCCSGLRTLLLDSDGSPRLSIDRPDPLGLSWRLWSGGSVLAETRRFSEKEIVWEARQAQEIDPAAVLVWLAGIAWWEAAAS